MENLAEPLRKLPIDLQSITEPFYVLNKNWEFIFMNARMAEHMQRDAKELLGRNIWEVYPQMKGTVLEENFKKVAATGKPTHFEEYWAPNNNWYEVYIYPVADDFGLYINPITERKRLEKQLGVKDGILLQPKGDLENIILEAEQKVLKIQELLLETQELAHIGSYEWNATMDKTIGTPQQYKIFGLSENTEVNMDVIMSIIHPDDRAFVAEGVQHAIITNSVFTGEYRLVLADGTIKHVWAKSRPVLDDNGRLLKYLGTVMDVTERKRAEEELRASQALLLEVQAIAGVGSYQFDVNTGISVWSPELYRIFGLGPEHETSADTIIQYIHPDDRELVLQRLGNARASNAVYSSEHRIILPDGTLKHISSKGKPVLDEHGNTIRFIGSVIDITERKQAEEKIKANKEILRNHNRELESKVAIRTQDLQRSESRLKEAQRISKVGDWDYDIAGGRITWSEETFYIHGMNPADGEPEIEEMLKLFVNPTELNQYIEAALNKGIPYQYDTEIIDRKGERKYLQIIGKPVMDDTGKCVRLYGTVMDISARKRAELELARSREQLDRITNALPVLISYVDKDYRYQYVNETYGKWFKMPAENFIGSVMARHISEEFYNSVKPYMDQALSGKPVDFQTQVKTRSGNVKIVNVRMIPDIAADGAINGFNALITDITEHVQARRSLEESEERLRFVFESMPQMAWTAGADGVLNYLNPRWYDYTGQPAIMDEMEGWKYAQHPRDINGVLEKWQQSVTAGEVFEYESRFKRAAGATWRWHLTRAVPIRNEQGEVTMWVGTCTDIHDQKMLIDQKDEFIGIASHELKTPLTSMKAYVQLMERTLAKGEVDVVKIYVQKANIYVDRLSDLISDLLDVSRIQAGKLQFNTTVFDFDEMVRDTVESIQSITHLHTIHFKGATAIQLTADRQRIEQVLTNLLTNAIKYSGSHTEIEVTVNALPDAVQVSVKDQGIGIAGEKHTKVFDRFYRVDNTNKNISGLGIGLYISAEIISRHKGRIWLESEEGKGATFHFTVPLDLIEVI